MTRVHVEISYTVEKDGETDSDARRKAAMEAMKLIKQVEGKEAGMSVGTQNADNDQKKV